MWPLGILYQLDVDGMVLFMYVDLCSNFLFHHLLIELS